jgi:hypothetical protein
MVPQQIEVLPFKRKSSENQAAEMRRPYLIDFF